jgi:hypothetical protein
MEWGGFTDQEDCLPLNHFFPDSDVCQPNRPAKEAIRLMEPQRTHRQPNRPAKEAILFLEPQRTHRQPNRPDCGSHWLIKSSHFLKGAWAKTSEQMVRFLQWGFLIRILARDFSRHCQGIRLGRFKKCMGATNHSARAVVWLLYDNVIGR